MAASGAPMLKAYVSREAVEACVDWGSLRAGPLRRRRYVGYVDPSGGRPTVSPSALPTSEDEHRHARCRARDQAAILARGVVSEFAELCKRYRITKITGDHYAGEWPREQFAKRGIKYEPSEHPKGTLSGLLAADQLGQGAAARQQAVGQSVGRPGEQHGSRRQRQHRPCSRRPRRRGQCRSRAHCC